MRDSTELATDLLDGRLAPPHEPEDPASATWIAGVAQLADRGDHDAAAREAAALIEARIYDVRVIGFYLFGVFLQRGVAGLPALLDRAGTLVADELAALRPTRRKLQVVSSATAWLFENISARLLFHTKHRDATWESWRAAGDATLADAIAAGCTKVTLALEAVIEAPLAVAPLARIRRWTNEDLRRALVRREAAERAAAVATAATEAAAAEPPEPPDEPPPPDEPADEPPPPDEPAEEPPDGALELAADPPATAPAPDEPVAVGSPALATLQAKLRGFQTLVARGELAKAAVVAADLRAVLTHFDPVAFFPSMFAGYFKALHGVMNELAPYFDGVDHPSWHALDSYYRADMRGFFDD